MDKGKKGFFGKVAIHAGSPQKTFRRMLMSVVSLIISFFLLTSMTFSWFSIKTSELQANNFSLDCGKGLRVNDSGTSQLSFSQQNNYLIPASSVDGRNLFFPTDGVDFSNVTESMTFRSANVGDKNQNYIQIDFTLTAQQNHTALYINDTKTSIKVKSSQETEWSVSQAASLRSALWASTAENGLPNTPVVFNPTGSTVRTAAVEDVDRSTGAFISAGRQVAHAFSEYSFGGTPVATLSKGVETKFSYIIWLEGTDPKCTDKILSKDIQINLAFTTSWDKTQTIRFEDKTENYWVTSLLKGNDNYSLSLHYEEIDSGASTDFNMWKYNENEAHVWSCNIPGDMTNRITFVLRSSDTSNPTYVFKYSSKVSGTFTYDRGANRMYVAELGAYTANDYTTCQGYWMALGDSDGAGHDSGGFDGDDF